MSSPRAQLISGVKAILPVLLGVFPFGMISGVAAVGVGIPAGISLAMSFIIFAGASQLAAVQLLGEGAPILVIIFTALIINLRFVMYSASIAPYFQRIPTQWKGLLAYLLTDQAYAVAVTHFQKNPELKHKRWFFLGAALPIWITWQFGSFLGVFLGAQVPSSWSLDFTIPLTFMALAVLAIKDRATVAAALSAGLVAVAAAGLPFNLGLLSAVLTGIVVGLFVESR